MAINLFSLVSAVEFTFDSPSSVEINEEFEVKIDAETTEDYDIKIFVHNSQDEQIKSEEYISEIYDGDWKNPWYYLKENFPEKNEFEIRVTSSPGDREICVRLRKSNSKEFDTECKQIEVIEQEEIEELSTQEPEEEIPEETTLVEKREESSEEKEVGPEPLPSPEQPTQLTKSLEEKSEKLEQTVTKSHKIQKGIIYSFLAFLTIVSILLALRRL